MDRAREQEIRLAIQRLNTALCKFESSDEPSEAERGRALRHYDEFERLVGLANSLQIPLDNEFSYHDDAR